jgi:superfamily II DNA/RNA helicase
MPTEIKRVSKKYMKSPVEITVGKMNTASKNFDHQFYVASSHHRYEALKRLIDFNPGIYGLIFTRTKADAQKIAEKLTREGYDIDALHGDLTQGQRDKVMGEFREKTLQLLIATDVAARGIDVVGITHVINYELPDVADNADDLGTGVEPALINCHSLSNRVFSAEILAGGRFIDDQDFWRAQTIRFGEHPFVGKHIF